MTSLFLCLFLVVPMTLSFQFSRHEFEQIPNGGRLINPARIRQSLDKIPWSSPQKRDGFKTNKRAESTGGFLQIKEAPPKLLEARQHGKTTLECSASGNPAPRITWYKDGEPLIKEIPSLEEGDFGEFSIESLSETKSKISIDCVSEEDAGLYECVAHTDQKKTSVETEVHVVSFEPNGCVPRHLMNFESSAPKIFQWMGTYMQVIGMEAHLICRAEGHHTTIWFGPDDQIIDDHASNRYRIKENGDLIIRDLSFNDMGMFKCLAKNDNGEDFIETFVYPLAPM